MTEKDLKLSHLPHMWITLKGASDKTIEKMVAYMESRDNDTICFSNLEIEIWALDKLKGKYVRLSKDPPIKGKFWKKLREIVGVKKGDLHG